VFSPSLFPDTDYAHRLTVKRGDLHAFFAPTAEHDEIMAERNHWLNTSAHAYIGALPQAAALIAETARVIAPNIEVSGDANRDLIAIGCAVEPDIVLLKKGADDVFRVVAGCVCFPSSWSLPEKLGLPLDQVHSVVPDLNTSIGPPIARFLAKMQRGTSWERSNWGLSGLPDRNQHPTRKLPPLAPPLSTENTWLRVEEQILAVLPETGGLLFGIRIVRETLAHIQNKQPEIMTRLQRALATMPDEMAGYKNFAAVRDQVVGLLGRSASITA
jgi:dimethylamine monooxygenase subunit A